MKRLAKKVARYGLTALEEKIYYLLLDPANVCISRQELAKKAGCNASTLTNILRKPHFQKACMALSVQSIRESVPAILKNLARMAAEGNVKAMETVMALLGLNTANPQIMVNISNSANEATVVSTPEQAMERIKALTRSLEEMRKRLAPAIATAEVVDGQKVGYQTSSRLE